MALAAEYCVLSVSCVFGVSWRLGNFLVYVHEIRSVCMRLRRRHQRKSFGLKISRYRNTTTQLLSNPVCFSVSVSLSLTTFHSSMFSVEQYLNKMSA